MLASAELWGTCRGSSRIDAIAFKFQTGTQWVHLPEKDGNWRGVYNRLRMWAVDGTWERVFTALVAQADADEDLACLGQQTGRPCHRPLPRRTDHQIHLADAEA
ncbi:transposase [Streptomyces albogriseolus]|uniref:transposase n=1 Tax=Streptomyces albogriseolus TaxID=1887 RepID=UPI0037962D40